LAVNADECMVARQTMQFRQHQSGSRTGSDVTVSDRELPICFVSEGSD
jgi:hypothetical protein